MDQLRIAVCDDDQEERGKIRKILGGLFESVDVSDYESGSRLLDVIRGGGRFDLVILDIYLVGEDGIEIGRQIRERSLAGFRTEIVFISNSRDFGPEAYELDALHYLLKPYGAEEFREVRRRFLRRRESGEQREMERGAFVKVRNMEREIPLHRITYIESAHNDLIIHLATGSTVTVRGSLTEFMEQLDERYLRINRGIIVNMEAVEWMKTDSCRVGGLVFLLGRKNRAESKRKYNDWLFTMAMRGED